MLVVLNFCHNDRDQALNLLRWMKELGGCQNHDLFLQTNIISASSGLHQELHLLAVEMFAKVEMRVLDRPEERPWPWAANNAWRDYVFFSRMKVARPWLWLEPDCAPISHGWLDQIDAEYTRANRPFMGDEVTRPERRMSGVGVYPPYVTSYTKKLATLGPVAWDQYLANDIVPNCHFTNLIQHVWNVELGKPETIPTFPNADSLKLIEPSTALFHRNKDGTLIQRLRERLVPEIAPEPKGNPELEAALAEIERLKAEAANVSITTLLPVPEPTPPTKSRSEIMKENWAKRKAKKAAEAAQAHTL